MEKLTRDQEEFLDRLLEAAAYGPDRDPRVDEIAAPLGLSEGAVVLVPERRDDLIGIASLAAGGEDLGPVERPERPQRLRDVVETI